MKSKYRTPRVGTRFGKLCVTDSTVRVIKEHRHVTCCCACGTKKFIVRIERLYSGGAETCGCGSHPSKTGHAAADSRTYRSYQHMLRRVKTHKDYRNVRIAARWMGPHGFETFLAEMGPRPEGMTLGRILDGKLYSRDTAEWQTRAEQGANRRGRSAQKRFSAHYGHRTIRL
jgi:hypothetical protein